ncbi:TetR/AcrR family transcriptional regulator [Aureimonas pseudogalii]|uniref:AcrR family transcriptional regulator n=1 Tax=Aureimonas pseudogalii TaxID=1744844 RepID=A0A7W6H3D7_9HYPH|nr:TetR/AcrR family transcriptional regulator [Aureimonas pseudogalii]MBB3997951.1 AcrR family transcriptional regulator [Aureimonas pseudogalii]
MSDVPARSRDTAAVIRAAALGLIAAKGYAAVSMREIADGAGIRQGGIYNHFAAKQDILRALMVDHMEALIAAWEACPERSCPPAETLDAFVRFHISYHFTRPEAVLVAYMELRSLEPENFAAVEALRDRYERILRDILARGAAEGVFALRDPAVETRALIAMLTGVTTWVREGGRLSIADITDLYVDLVRRAVGLHPAHDRTRETADV